MMVIVSGVHRVPYCGRHMTAAEPAVCRCKCTSRILVCGAGEFLCTKLNSTSEITSSVGASTTCNFGILKLILVKSEPV